MTILFCGEDVTWIFWALLTLWATSSILQAYGRIQRKRIELAERKRASEDLEKEMDG